MAVFALEITAVDIRHELRNSGSIRSGECHFVRGDSDIDAPQRQRVQTKVSVANAVDRTARRKSFGQLRATPSSPNGLTGRRPTRAFPVVSFKAG